MRPAGVVEEAGPRPPAAVDIAAGEIAAADHRVGAVAAAARGIADAVVVAEAGMLAVVVGTGPAEHAEWPYQGCWWPGGWWLTPEVVEEVG